MASVGFVGLGEMGGPMAVRLLEDGHSLTVYERGDELDRVWEAGADVVDTYAAVAENSDAVFICVPGPAQVESVVHGPGGLAEGLSSGDVLVDTTTSLPSVTERLATELADRDVAVMSAPISGGRSAAETGTLTVMAGGSKAAYERVRPLADAFASNVYYVGEAPELGHVMKLVNNYVSFAGVVVTMEAISLGERAGLELETMVDVLNASSGRNYATEVHFPKRVVGDAAVRDPIIDVISKDLDLTRSFADDERATMLLGDVVRDLVRYMEADLGGEATMKQMYEFIQQVQH